MPAEHFVQLVAPAGEYVPAEHDINVIAPVLFVHVSPSREAHCPAKA